MAEWDCVRVKVKVDGRTVYETDIAAPHGRLRSRGGRQGGELDREHTDAHVVPLDDRPGWLARLLGRRRRFVVIERSFEPCEPWKGRRRRPMLGVDDVGVR